MPEVLDKQDMFTRFIEFLNDLEVEYCLVGDTSQFPEKIQGDIDIIVPADALNSIVSKLVDSGDNPAWPWKVVQAIQSDSTSCYMILAVQDTQMKASFFHLDFYGQYSYQGRLLLTDKELLRQRLLLTKTVPFYVPDAPLAYIYYLLKRINKQDLTKEHGDYLYQQFIINPIASREQLFRFFGNAEVELLVLASEQNQWEDIQDNLTGFRDKLYGEAFKIGKFLNVLRKIANRFSKPTGFWVVFLGPDGCGKSAVLNLVREQLAPPPKPGFFRYTEVCHLKPTLGNKCNRGEPVAEPQGQPPRGLFMSYIKLFYLGVQYWLGYYLKVRPALMRSTLVLFDRYLVDMVIDPRRFRYQGSLVLVHWLIKCIPQPDLYIVLHADAKVLQERKQEVPFEETERQLSEYTAWARKCTNAVIIDVDCPLTDVVSKVNHAILSALAKNVRQDFCD